MSTNSSVLAWEIPWTEEPGGQQSVGSQRVGHHQSDWAARTHGGTSYSLSRALEGNGAGDWNCRRKHCSEEKKMTTHLIPSLSWLIKKNKHTPPPAFKNHLMGRTTWPQISHRNWTEGACLSSVLSHTFLLRNVSSHPDSLQRRPQPFQPRAPSASGPERLRCRRPGAPVNSGFVWAPI